MFSYSLVRYLPGPNHPPIQNKNKNAALQVRTGGPEGMPGNGGKRACSGVPASYTVEAALVLPLFLMAMMLLALPFRVMEAHRKMQDVCEEICALACQFAYSDPEIREEEQERNGAGELMYYAASGALGGYAAERAREAAEDANIGTILFLGSDFLTDGEMVTVMLEYSYHLPFSVFGLGDMYQTVSSSRRGWIGTKRAKSDGEEEEDPLVYVGKASTRYHLSPSCHYLHNNLKAVPFSQVEGLRNDSGGRYYPCKRCGSEAGPGSAVYIMPSGSSYHSRSDCSAIISYVRTVRKSEVEHLGACSYCGGS